MGLREAVDQLATRRVHALVLEIPGDPLLRMHLEAALTARGWILAEAPADADVLMVCGEPTEPFHEIIDALWDQLPSPRYRVSVTTPDAVAAALDSIAAGLRDRHAQVLDARQRPARLGPGTPADHVMETSHGDHTTMDAATMDHTAHGDQMDMGGMDMDMSGPAGIPLAGGDEGDRDGLEMDVIHLTLGPVLPHWPAGLVVRCTLRGDVIGAADVDFLTGPGRHEPAPEPAARPSGQAAGLCDAAGHLLAIAGWQPVAEKVLRVRNDLIGDGPAAPAVSRLNRARRQIARSRTLRWSLRGIAASSRVDARALLLDWLATAAALLSGERVSPRPGAWPASLEDLSSALIGQELSGARLLVACIEPSRVGALAGEPHG